MNTLTINNVELELDLLDADVLEKYEALNQRIVEQIQDRTKYEGLSNADQMRYQCAKVNEFFDELFGAGTSDKVFGLNSNLGIRLEAFGAVSKYAAETTSRIREVQDKYTRNPAASIQQGYKNHKNKHGNRPGFNATQR